MAGKPPSEFEICFAPSTFGAGGPNQNTSRIQHKDVSTPFCVQAWEGGTRTAAFVAGGLVPPRLRGTTNDALFYVTDWYAILCDV